MGRLEHFFGEPHGSCAVVGAQWGDEGKGKIADILADDADVVARWQGGPNAGHTVVFGGDEYVTHGLPVGVFHADTVNIVGAGCVVDLAGLREEVGELADAIRGDIVIDRNATVITPWQQKIDAGHDEDEEGEEIVGTTNRGIGPTYAARASRVALRVGDLDLPDARAKIERLADWCHSRAQAEDVGLDPDRLTDPDELLDQLRSQLDGLRELGVRVEASADRLESSLDPDSDDRVLFEGAQGTMLGLYSGNYPYVTSSDPTAAGIAAGCNVAPGKVDRVVGIAKAYTTRVGGDDEAFLCGRAIDDAVAEHVREVGGEYGATTGRPRKVGWLDLPALRYAQRINDFDGLVITKADVLADLPADAGVDSVGMLDAYRDPESGETIESYRACLDHGRLEPGERVDFDRWTGDLQSLRVTEALPERLADFLNHVERTVGTTIPAVSIGPGRDQLAI